MKTVEVQACAGLVNVSSVLDIEEDDGGRASQFDALSAALRRERRRNAELLEKVSVLQDRIKTLERHAKCGCNADMVRRCSKKFKRQEAGCATTTTCRPFETGNNIGSLHMNCVSDDEADDHKDKENQDPGGIPQLHHRAADRPPLSGNIDAENASRSFVKVVDEDMELEKCDRKETVSEDIKEASVMAVHFPDRFMDLLSGKKYPKVAFCPREVRRIVESDTLLQKNAHSHTLRKIIAFSSLGTQHGCEDMLELDFSHFHIVRKGQGADTTDLEEHVLYENPGVRKKIFHPNKKNPALCPVQILEEEELMRPADVSCPSCLFLCIKYGGRTRNLPQNEYVRQRMGRNKLKSFGPMMCRTAMLVHVRGGGFFFKTLGITLLFMAGFSDDVVKKETEYRSLDLLRKYYRTDAETEGQEVFLPHRAARPETQRVEATKRSKGKRKPKPDNSQRSSMTKLQPPHISSAPPSSQFELLGYPASTQQPTSADSLQLLPASPSVTPCHNQTSYPAFPPQPNHGFMPVIY
uniref:Uncharacterized protein n=1 Tax=Kalanchoe fedtschenkoi TaxID=63787 RepID=A0A7N0UF75_KALFE